MRIECWALLSVMGLSASACSPTTMNQDGGAADASALDAAEARDAADAVDAGSFPGTLGPDDRPARLVVPSAHDGATPLPAVVLLHGYGGTAAWQDAYFGLSREADSAGFYVVLPDGTVDGTDKRFWNATPACCDFQGTEVDDVAYLSGLLDELEGLVPVSDVFFVGHSNGGFMSYRIACELAERVSAIVSLAGSDFARDTDCVPERPVSVLQIHGDADAVIPYGGASGLYPSAEGAAARWAERASCDLDAATPGEPLDLDSGIAGAETETLRYREGCSGAEAELWTIRSGAHIPALGPAFAPSVLAWLSEHRR